MKIKPFIPAIVWWIAITYLSVTPHLQLPKFQLFSSDKLAHAAAYALLSVLLLRGIGRSGMGPTNGRPAWLVFFIASGYGAFMEWVQGTFFPNRFFEYDDMIANAAGAFLAIMLYPFLKRYIE